MKLMVTGHRPNKLFGYDITKHEWQLMKSMFQKFIIEKQITEVITGMALGVDTVMALAVLELKEQGNDIKLHCAIPCQNHDSKWLEPSRKMYKDILDKADIITLVTDKPYSANLMQIRNEFMVDNADICLAVWNGDTSGGTYNCIKYIEKVGKKCFKLAPSVITMTFTL